MVRNSNLLRLLACLLPLFVLTIAGKAGAVSAPSVERMIGAMLMTGFRGEKVPPAILEAVRAGRLGGVILFDRDVRSGGPRNVRSPDQLRALTASLEQAAREQALPLLIAVDQEGGSVRRLKESQGFFPLPSAEAMGQRAEADVRRLGFLAGQEMASLGINVDLAPVVDIQRSAWSPGLGELGRLFGRDVASVTSRALAFAEGLYQAGVLPVLKHFPGLGSADKDSHLSLPDVSRHWNRSELIPYAEAFRRNWPGMVLVAHVYHRTLDALRPSSLSAAVIEGMLRQQMGWRGVVISDDLQMGAVSTGRTLEEILLMAVEAGNDILLLGNNLRYEEDLHERAFRILRELVRQGRISRERLERSWQRLQVQADTLRRLKKNQ